MLAIEMKKIMVAMDKLVYVDFQILDINKIPIFQFWYDYVKQDYGNKSQLCYEDTDSLKKTEDMNKYSW